MEEEAFEQVLRRLRGRRTLEAVAKAAGISTSYVHKLENGHGTPTIAVVEALDAATHAGGELIEAYARNEALVFGDDATERRRLLRIVAGFGSLGPTEALRQLIDLTTPTTRSIEDWELACADHLHAIRHRPPADVRRDVHLDLGAVLRQCEQAAAQLGADHARTRGLYRALAALSTLHANVLTRLGDHGAAIRWWRSARHAADASGDLHLRLGVRSTEAGHGIGGQRDPATVLRMLDTAQPLVDRAPTSYGAALIDYTRSRALSMAGRHDEARTTLERISETLGTGLLPVSIMPGYWRAGQLPFARVWVHSAAGDLAQAAEARDLVIASNPDYQYPVIAKLLTAQCTVVSGGVDEGLREAAQILDRLPPMHRTTPVMQAGRMVLAAVPVEQRERAMVGDLRSMLALEN